MKLSKIKADKRQLIRYFILNAASAAMSIYLIYESAYSAKHNPLKASLYYPTTVYVVFLLIVLLFFIFLIHEYNKCLKEEIIVYGKMAKEAEREELRQQQIEAELKKAEYSFLHDDWDTF